MLVLTLWLIAGIAALAGVIAAWSLMQVQQAADMREEVDDLQALVGSRDTLIYMVLTNGVTRGGIPVSRESPEMFAMRRLDPMAGMGRPPSGNEMQVDGAWYEGLDEVVLQVQDEAGLISLNMPSERMLNGLLTLLEVPSGQFSALRDHLLDYTDSDSLRRLNGAEAPEYLRMGLQPPPNRRLLVSRELERIPPWAELPADARHRLVELTRPRGSHAINLNSTPEALLPLFMGGCPDSCERFVALRQQSPFRSGPEVEARVGVRLAGDSMFDYRFAPSEFLRLTLQARHGSAWRVHVHLTPLADQRAPWSMVAAYPMTRLEIDEPIRSTGSPLFPE